MPLKRKCISLSDFEAFSEKTYNIIDPSRETFKLNEALEMIAALPLPLIRFGKHCNRHREAALFALSVLYSLSISHQLSASAL